MTENKQYEKNEDKYKQHNNTFCSRCRPIYIRCKAVTKEISGSNNNNLDASHAGEAGTVLVLFVSYSVCPI